MDQGYSRVPPLQQRTYNLWKTCQGEFPDHTPGNAEFRWKAHGKTGGKVHKRELLSEILERMIQAADDPRTHWHSLDSILSDELLCHFAPRTSKYVREAAKLLSRLPPCPPKISFHLSHRGTREEMDRPWPADYIHSAVLDTSSIRLQASPWEELKVAQTIDSCTTRLALTTKIVGMNNPAAASTIKGWLDMLAELLDLSQQSHDKIDVRHRHTFHVLGTFLWCSWQRSAMVFFTYVLENQLRGYERAWNELLALRGPSLLSHQSAQTSLNGRSNPKSGYMCSWAFELLRSSHASIGLDFRTFHSRFEAAHGRNEPRCTLSSSTCDGSSPESCGRFTCKTLVRGDQSVHDETCTGSCEKVLWDRDSYLSVRGGRAILLERNPKKIRYCKVSESTLAISHVWSHGQGGRPSTGINSCIHHRYVELAEANSCTSYWMDTICIPEEHELRREAIMNINKTFSLSKIVLVCDRDMMSMPAPHSCQRPLFQEECLIATLLVCDWNVRAWTMLEAIRGSHNLHILCKNNALISVKALIQNVLRAGSLDLATLSLATQHLLATAAPPPGSTRRHTSRKSIEDASNLLSHRYATRPGDDIVIWSLLCSTSDVFDDPVALWKSTVHIHVNTAYLMSSAPRIKHVRGFSWAPASPNVRANITHQQQQQQQQQSPTSDAARGEGNAVFFSHDGGGSSTALVTATGLRGDWRVHEVREEDEPLYQGHPQTVSTQLTASPSSSSGVTSTVVAAGGRSGINRCWAAAMDLLRRHGRAMLIQPCSGSTTEERYEAAEERGRGGGPLCAVCFADEGEDGDGEGDVGWEWAGVWEWERDIPLPRMESKFVVLV